MKKYLSIILITFLTISLSGCGFGLYTTKNTNDWLEYELPPSRIVRNGEVFFEGKLSDGSRFTVFADEKIEVDARYYYVKLMQDFGWKSKDENTWNAPQGSRMMKLGNIYINPSRRAAVYYNPNGKYSAFKVNIVK